MPILQGNNHVNGLCAREIPKANLKYYPLLGTSARRRKTISAHNTPTIQT